MERSRRAGASILVTLTVLMIAAPATSASNPTPPESPWGLLAVPMERPGDGSAKALLAWQVPRDDGGSPILGYRVYRVTSNETGLENVTLVGETQSTSHLDTAPVPEGSGLLLEYRVTATNAVGESSTSGSAYTTRGPGCLTVVTSTPPNVILDPACFGSVVPYIRRICLRDLDICLPGA